MAAAGEATEFRYPFLALTPARRLDWNWAAAWIVLSTLGFLVLLPLASHALTPMPGFIGVYQSALVLLQLLIALLLFAKFQVLRLQALLYLASAHLFSAAMAVAHALSFPGLFGPTGLLVGTPQTTAWLYLFWHLGFPLLVVAYARTKRMEMPAEGSRDARPIVKAVASVLVVVAGIVALCGPGAWLLPPVMAGNTQNFPVMKPLVSCVCAVNLAALLVLWRSRPHSVLDVWLMITCSTWVFDVALSAVFNASRYDVGFYFGRAYGLMSALLVLGALLVESTRYYGALLAAHAHDIALNAELQRMYDKAQELDKLKTRFFANMSHEIRTPMNAILGITHLLQRGNPTPAQAERLDKIAVAGEHLLSIIKDILDFSKIESGGLELEQFTFPVSAILDHARSMIEETARAKGLTVQVDYDDCPRWLVGDATRLRQAMLNFASNAVKFTEHGRIWLRCAVVERAGDEAMIRFEVDDTGIGIPAEAIPELFKAFRQVDASTTRKYGGTGLGLAITQRLAQLMGGDVGVDSVPGRGSRFWFTARLKVGSAPAQRAQGDAERELRERRQGVRVLLTEDDPVNQEIARELLEEAGLKVTLASNGQQAVEQAQAAEFDLILMDIQMPVLDGVEATRQIRQLEHCREVPVIALTANIFDEDRRRCRHAGMSDFLGKPVDPKELFATLLKWLPERPRAGSAVPDAAVTPPVVAPFAAERDLVLVGALSVLDGLDLGQGLSVVRGNVGRYWKFLQDFSALHADAVSRIRAALVNGDTAEAVRAAHSVKGAAATLGLVALQSHAARLELALKGAEADWSTQAERLDQSLQELARAVAGIRHSLETSGA